MIVAREKLSEAISGVHDSIDTSGIMAMNALLDVLIEELRLLNDTADTEIRQNQGGIQVLKQMKHYLKK